MATKVVWEKVLIIAFLLGLFLTADCPTSLAQNAPQTFTLLYTNNIWAEIDPCPV